MEYSMSEGVYAIIHSGYFYSASSRPLYYH